MFLSFWRAAACSWKQRDYIGKMIITCEIGPCTFVIYAFCVGLP